MSERTDKDFLSDIQEAIRRIEEYTAGMTYQAFLEDTKSNSPPLVLRRAAELGSLGGTLRIIRRK